MGGQGPPGGYWSEGTVTEKVGLLFGETPPPAGQSRVMEGWELPWCAASPRARNQP